MALTDLRPRPVRRSPYTWTDLTTERARTVVYGLLVAFWFTLPWESVVKIGGGSATLARGVGAVLTVGAAAALLVAGRRVRPDAFVALMLALASLVVVSSYWTVTPGATEQRTVTMVQLVVMVLVTWEFAHTRKRVEGLMAAWVAGAVVVGVVASFAFVTGQAETRYSAPGTSHGDVAYSLLVAVPMAWYLSIITRRTALIWAYRLFVPFACFGVVLTASRAGLLSMGFALAIVPLTLRWISPGGRIWVAIAALASAGGALVLATEASGPIARLATTSSEITSGTLDQRTTLWGIALQQIREHPLLGLGAGGSKNAVSGEFYTARGLHNTFLSVTTELGVVGLTLFLLLMLAAIYRALTGLPPLESRTAWVLAVIFVISLVPRHADYFKSTYALLTLLALMGQLLVRRPPREPDPVVAGAAGGGEPATDLRRRPVADAPPPARTVRAAVTLPPR